MSAELYRLNQEAMQLNGLSERTRKAHLRHSYAIHLVETGINLGKYLTIKNSWLCEHRARANRRQIRADDAIERHYMAWSRAIVGIKPTGLIRIAWHQNATCI